MAFTKILLPVDGSEPAKRACKYAMDLAAAFKAEIHMVHCYEDIPLSIGGQAREELTKEAAAAAEAIMTETCRTVKDAGLLCTTHIVHGDPDQNIVQAAIDNGCDIIVMGTRGLGDFQGMVLGSVSHQVLQTSPVPVLLTR